MLSATSAELKGAHTVDHFDSKLESRFDATSGFNDRELGSVADAPPPSQTSARLGSGSGSGSFLRRVSLDARTLSNQPDPLLSSGTAATSAQAKSGIVPDAYTKDAEADGGGGGSEWRAAPSSPPSSAAMRRRKSLMSTSWAASNVTGSSNVLSKRLTASKGDETVLAGAAGLISEAERLKVGRAATAAFAAPSERPASSSTIRRRSQATELSDCDVVLPGFRSRTLSARTAAASVKLNDPRDIAWTRAFKIDYAPLSFNDVKRRRSQSEFATTVSTGGPQEAGRVALASGQDFVTRRRPWAERVPVDPERGGRVEVHYESCLPKEQWLQLRPKKFVFNHKHGAPFEKRWMNTPRKIDGVQELTVWENSYHILLLEKAVKDS